MELREYISSYMPVSLIVQFFTLSCSYYEGMSLEHREFSFTQADGKVQRYRSLPTTERMRQILSAAQPQRFDVGALYTAPMKFFKLGVEKQPIVKELTIDIDIDAYNSIRACDCALEPRLCPLCWRFIVSAVRVLEDVLDKVFGFTTLFWEFSGRRGVHCWVLDDAAVCSTEKFRQHLTEFLSPFKTPNHYYFAHQFPRLFEEICDSLLVSDFELLLSSGGVNPRSHEFSLYLFEALKLGGFDAVPFVNSLIQSADERLLPLEYWHYLCEGIRRSHPKGANVIRITILSILFPRIDKSVTKTLNHLLKVPFSWHPDTKTICVPFRSFDVDEFPIDQLPNLGTGENFEGFHHRYVRPLQDFLMPFTHYAALYLCLECVSRRELNELSRSSIVECPPVQCHPNADCIPFTSYIQHRITNLSKRDALVVTRSLYQEVRKIFDGKGD